MGIFRKWRDRRKVRQVANTAKDKIETSGLPLSEMSESDSITPEMPSATGRYEILTKAMDANLAGAKEARSSVQRLLNTLGIAPKTPRKK
jgi:hypothetical protein